MGLNDTVSAERINIGFFGLTNSGKSSLVNAVTGQNMSVVSPVNGTTTDAVKKAMELMAFLISSGGTCTRRELTATLYEERKGVKPYCQKLIVVSRWKNIIPLLGFTLQRDYVLCN